jgi:signal peptidase II
MQATPGAPLTAGGTGGPAGGSTPRTRLPWLALILAAVVWATDLVTKVVAVAAMTDRADVQLVPGVLNLTLTRNSGAAFSLGTSLTPVLTVVACVVVVVVLRLLSRVRSTGWAVGLGLLLGGALGNLTDRIFRSPGPFRGHVVDFLELPHWPVFNVADCCIVVAAGLIAVQSLRGVGMDGSRATTQGADTPDESPEESRQEPLEPPRGEPLQPPREEPRPEHGR